MGAMAVLVASQVWTREDLEHLPDDGQRYEIIDGVLVVTPSPLSRHQFVLSGLYDAMRAACPDHLRVVFAPLDVVLGDDTVLEPDLLVARRDQFDRRGLPARPELAVEVLSPSTLVIDRGIKREAFERAGVPAYWLVDPDGPSLTAYELVDRRLVEVAQVGPGETCQASIPYAVVLTPGTWAD